MHSSKIEKSNRASSLSIRSALALVVGFLEMTAQYSGICLEKSSVPIARAVSMISCLSVVANGLRTKVFDA